MDALQAIILGIVQGITEWLPISSKSHLIIFERLFGLSQPIIFDIALHLGSLVVVLIVFWKDIVELISGVFRLKKDKLRLLLFLVIGSIPIAIAGYFFNDFFKAALKSDLALGAGFLFTALVIFTSRYPKRKQDNITYSKALIVGIGQAFALLPGVSRSGTTISTGMMLGIRKEDVARFSFLLFIPAIIGATVLESGAINELESIPLLILGIITTVIVGYLSLRLLLDIIKKDKFHYFAWYCLALGLIMLFSAI